MPPVNVLSEPLGRMMRKNETVFKLDAEKLNRSKHAPPGWCMGQGEGAVGWQGPSPGVLVHSKQSCAHRGTFASRLASPRCSMVGSAPGPCRKELVLSRGKPLSERDCMELPSIRLTKVSELTSELCWEDGLAEGDRTFQLGKSAVSQQRGQSVLGTVSSGGSHKWSQKWGQSALGSLSIRVGQ